jgi:hypothetical protein
MLKGALMGARSFRLAACLAAVALFSAPKIGNAVPTEVGGGGIKSTDCLTTFVAEVNLPPTNAKHVRCIDGDPACDTDMAINGVCAIALSICLNSTFEPLCTLNGVEDVVIDHADDNVVDSLFDTGLQTLQGDLDNNLLATPPNTTANDCTNAAMIRVHIKGPIGNNVCSRSKTKKVRLTTTSQLISGREYRDVDVIKLQCDPNPAPAGCDPQMLWPSGTFERINEQVFDQSCALGGCHNSNFQAGGLLLEPSASFANLVEQDPINPFALNDMWKRVDVIVQDVSGDPANSYIMHKIENDTQYPLPNPGYGGRMPQKTTPNGFVQGPKLHPTLRDIIETWILNGAPMNGWVPGTF